MACCDGCERGCGGCGVRAPCVVLDPYLPDLYGNDGAMCPPVGVDGAWPTYDSGRPSLGDLGGFGDDCPPGYYQPNPIGPCIPIRRAARALLPPRVVRARRYELGAIDEIDIEGQPGWSPYIEGPPYCPEGWVLEPFSATCWDPANLPAQPGAPPGLPIPGAPGMPRVGPPHCAPDWWQPIEGQPCMPLPPCTSPYLPPGVPCASGTSPYDPTDQNEPEWWPEWAPWPPAPGQMPPMPVPPTQPGAGCSPEQLAQGWWEDQFIHHCWPPAGPTLPGPIPPGLPPGLPPPQLPPVPPIFPPAPPAEEEEETDWGNVLLVGAVTAVGGGLALWGLQKLLR